ncbi:hypothetical protein HG264_01335 [Pseudomonas sp. gcc21]|uniref:hypothetical protein n=1 Tax=Pseudomonas sp. gcc21 TaxID=2726989 RepID=UPI00145153F1|nr:hypothetical protein [Pseudomonas sp. gcc21]QJD57645.1 hypothetical protein HG264_01335 [Pseudomonas sp. gcc21]
MSNEPDPTPVIDLVEARQRRRHDLYEARLNNMRARFEQALPLSSGSGKPKSRKARKKKPKR